MLYAVVCLCATVCAVYKTIKYMCGGRMVGKLNERYVFITGCDSGFGRELCGRLDEMGCKVFAACYTEQGLNDLRTSFSVNVKPLRLDVTEEASVQRAKEFVLENLPKGKGLWAVVNNAGIAGVFAPLTWLQSEHYSVPMETNFMGPVRVMLSMLPLLKPLNAAEWPRLVNMTSILSTHHIPLSSPYSTSKAALQTLSAILRTELRDFGIRVVTIQPGLHNTTFTHHLRCNFASCWSEMDGRVKEVYGQKYYEKASDNVTLYSNFLSGKDSHTVAEAYIQALFSTNPYNTYIIGLDSLLLRVGYGLFGEWLWIVAAWFRIFRKPEKSLCCL